MSYYLQYFNVEKMGRFPNGAEALFTQRMGVFTKLATVQQARGATVFVIAGLGKPKNYYLWESFTIEDVTHDGEQYTLSGPGWVLLPPQKLEGKAFEAFKSSCAGFISFRKIDDLSYHKTLHQLAGQFHGAEPDSACESFCDELIRQLPKMGDSYYYRATVRDRLGKTDGAKEDFRKAIEVGTNFRHEADLALRGGASKKPAPATAGTREKITDQIVSRGRFAKEGETVRGDRKPFDMPDPVWDAICHRRGPAAFREKVLKAYDGRCAITGASGTAALEAAYIVGDEQTGPHEASNGLLLRADIHVLFDLHLIRIHPRTRKIILSDELRKSTYARLSARRLRLPEKEENRPSLAALQQRWDAAGGSKA